MFKGQQYCEEICYCLLYTNTVFYTCTNMLVLLSALVSEAFLKCVTCKAWTHDCPSTENR